MTDTRSDLGLRHVGVPRNRCEDGRCVHVTAGQKGNDCHAGQKSGRPQGQSAGREVSAM